MNNSIHNYIHSLREHFASYHDHKEQMAFAATGLYIGGVTALLSQGKLGWLASLPGWASTSFIVLLALVAFLFIWWQFSMREYAAKMVEACDNLRTNWLANPPADMMLAPATFEGNVMPQVLAEELRVVAKNKAHNWRRALPRLITYIMLGIWTFFLICYFWM